MGRLAQQLTTGGGRLAQMLNATPPPPEKKSIGGFAKNVVKSAVNFGSGIGSALLNVFNPNPQKNTVANIMDLGAGALERGAGAFFNKPINTPETQKFDAVADFYKQRYGSGQAIKDTLYQDPIGVGADASALLTGAGGALRGAGAVSRVAGLSTAGKVLTRAGSVIDPINLAGATASKVSNFGGKTLAPKLEASAERLYQSALKPTKSTLAKNPDVIKTGLQERIPVSQKGYDEALERINKLNEQITAEIEKGNNAGKTVNPRAVASRVKETKARFTNQVAPQEDLAAIESKKQSFLNHPNYSKPNPKNPAQRTPKPIPIADAQKLKQGTYRELKGKFGQERTAGIEAEKALARGLKEEIAKQIPEIAELNAKDSRLIGLEEALDDFIRRSGNSQLIGLGTPLAVGGGYAITGSRSKALALGLVKAAIDNPEIKSRLAILLSDLSKGKPRGTRTVFGRALTPASRAETARSSGSPGL